MQHMTSHSGTATMAAVVVGVVRMRWLWLLVWLWGALACAVERADARPLIALTFDDGPNTTTTVAVLDRLEKYGVVASFFVVGQRLTDDTRPVVLRAQRLGCEINNHSLSHSHMGSMDAQTIAAEVNQTSERIFAITGRYPPFFRPPYLESSPLMLSTINLPLIGGAMAYDWDPATTRAQRVDHVLRQARDGAVIVLHDSEGNSQTVEALDLIIPQLLAQGYQLVTVSQLLAARTAIVR